jgi:hypothetical protein
VKTGLYVVFLSLLLWGCRAHLAYINDYPMSTKSFTTRDGNLRGLVPQGWFFSKDDTLTPALSAWLVKDDFTASISLRELSLDHIARERVQKDGLGLLATLSMKFHDEPGTDSIPSTQFKSFELQGKKFCDYEFRRPETRSRIIVFAIGGRYYECEAQPARKGWREEEINQLFRVQQSVIATLSP